jgi:hypothetical protein
MPLKSNTMGADELSAKISAIKALDRVALAQCWTERTGSPPPKRSTAKLLAMSLAYDLQLSTSPEADAAEKKIAKLLSRHLSGARTIPPPRRLSPGGRLLREWRGRTLVVDVVDDGFLFEGRVFRSLSAIAKEATGSARNGPAFFGLREGA